MERQFDQHHGTEAREFHKGDPVFVLKFQGHEGSWVPGTVTQHRGNVSYELTVHGKKETHHINHIRRRHPNICDRSEDISELPLDILLVTFELPTNTTESNTEENLARENPIIEIRHSRRTRALVKRFNVDPPIRSYEWCSS
ncbi:hypothetical protein PHET_06294 [Paragonimus heterotremus]|uniref:Uncharacterized protein n=1 Tax=Paragonimus heterotremus TaxID=100268 RepID=A0A8J4TC28_9TREM|nr:hypothetical protein PHET_06294 [Paragonimus heterotremus]